MEEMTIIIEHGDGVVVVTPNGENKAIVEIAENRLEKLVEDTGCEEGEILYLLAAMEQQRRDNNLSDGRKRPNRVKVEDIQYSLPGLLTRFSIDELMEIFSDMKYVDIQEILKSNDPCEVIQFKI